MSRKCPPRCPKSFRCDRKTKKNTGNRRCNPLGTTKKLKKPSPSKSRSRSRSRSSSSSSRSSGRSSKSKGEYFDVGSSPTPYKSVSPKINLAKFYDIANKVELSPADYELKATQQKAKFSQNITDELNSNNKYKLGDILFIGDGDKSDFAIVDEKNGKLTFVQADEVINLPWQILAKVKANHIKYRDILENKSKNDNLEMFNQSDPEGMIEEYKTAGIY